MAGRKIRDERDARRCLAAAKTARVKSLGQWARAQGIDGRSLAAWAKNLARGDSSRRAKSPRRKERRRSGLVELIPSLSTAKHHYQIRYGQMTVEVNEHFDEATLSRLLKVIATC